MDLLSFIAGFVAFPVVLVVLIWIWARLSPPLPEPVALDYSPPDHR
jgi:hypothetical protein